MRRLALLPTFLGTLRGLMLAGTVAACLAASSLALAAPSDTGEHRIPVDNTDFVLGPSRCGFSISVHVVSDKEFYVKTTTLADGTLIQRGTGKLVLSFTNLNPGGKTIVENVSGPFTNTIYPNGTGGVFDGQGHSWLAFGPIGQANTGEPGLVFTSGHVVVVFGPIAAESFTLSGRQTNGCELLS
jgi:hypothetical protein